MSTFKQSLAGVALGAAVFFAFATMLALSSGANIFKYQGF